MWVIGASHGSRSYEWPILDGVLQYATMPTLRLFQRFQCQTYPKFSTRKEGKVTGFVVLRRIIGENKWPCPQHHRVGQPVSTSLVDIYGRGQQFRLGDPRCCRHKVIPAV